MKQNLISPKLWRIMSEQELFEASKLDPTQRKAKRGVINKREQASKWIDWDIVLTELYQIKLEIERVLSKIDLSDIIEPRELTWPMYKDWPLLGQIIHTDLHIDRLTNGKCEKYLATINDKTMELFHTLTDKYKIDMINYANMGDYYNSDINRMSTKWTPQENSCDEIESYRYWTQHQIDTISTFSAKLPTNVIYTPWNHDRYKLQYLSELIKRYFEKTNNVKVNADDDFIKYDTRGKNLLMYMHWDLVKTKKILETVTQKKKLLDHNFMHKGHIHQRLIENLESIEVNTYPSPAQPSKREKWLWHTKIGKIYAQVFDKKKGKIAELSI